MVDFKADERLNTLNHSCAHVMAQAVKHLYPHAKFWVGPVVKEGFYYDIDLGDDVVNDDVIAAIEKEMKKICKEGKKIYRLEKVAPLGGNAHVSDHGIDGLMVLLGVAEHALYYLLVNVDLHDDAVGIAENFIALFVEHVAYRASSRSYMLPSIFTRA